MKNRLSVTICFIISLVIALFLSGLMLYPLIDNNNQGEFYNQITGQVDWIYLAELTLINLLFTYPAALVVVFTVRAMFDIFRR